jgi:hypothetical protein
MGRLTLRFQPLSGWPNRSGVSGEAVSVVLQTEFGLTDEGGGKALFCGHQDRLLPGQRPVQQHRDGGPAQDLVSHAAQE